MRANKLTGKTMSPIRLIALAAAVFAAGGCAPLRKDFTRGEAKTCEVHQRIMDKTAVPVHYGLMSVSARDDALYAASTNAFPHAKASLNPGCNVQRTREAIIYTCAECVRLRHQWEAAYDSKRH
jgi:hypothetical protein